MVLMLEMTNRDVRIGVSSRPQHHRVLQHTLRLHFRLSWRLRLRLQLQFLRSKAMAVLPSWSDSRGWLHPLLRGRVGERDGAIPGGEEGITEEISATISASGQEVGGVPVTAASSGVAGTSISEEDIVRSDSEREE
ncbi:hypothetical protein Taro_026047 [Colocasia esculenta]|uniref:Uncharacterized protein n=1 Tax=Colocasia esculenta TaxID=4460 RepID=A0A843VMD6_COLES|nr:hypothetical protein [Colocasia esculenta]